MSTTAPAPKGEIKLSGGQKAAGVGLMLAAGALALGGLYMALPFLLAMTWGLLQLGVGIGLLCLLFIVATDKTIHRIVGRLYKTMIWKVWWKLMTYDPIAQLKASIAEMETSHASMRTKREAFRGKITSLEQAQEVNETERRKSIKLINAVKDQNDAQALRVQQTEGRKAGRRQGQNEQYEKTLKVLRKADARLTEIYENAGMLIEDTKDQVDMAARNFVTMNGLGSLTDDAMAIINGDPEAKRMFNETIEFMNNEAADNLGKFQTMLTDTQGFIDSVNVQKAVYRQDAFEAVEAWGKESKNLRVGSKVRVDDSGYQEEAGLDTNAPAEQQARNLFADDK